MYTELKRNLPNLFLAKEATRPPTFAIRLTPQEEPGATHDFLVVMPLCDFALAHPGRRDPTDLP